LEGAIDYHEAVESDPQKLSALALSSLVQLDVKINGILKALKSIVSDQRDVSFMNILLTPIMAVSVSFACHLGLYGKAQNRLEDFLDNSNSTNRGASNTPSQKVLVYSELLWSQLVHLRASLPLNKAISGDSTKPTSKNSHHSKPLSSDLSESHKAIAERMQHYGVHLHHLCLTGDWKLLQRVGNAAQVQRPVETAKHKRELAALITNRNSPIPINLRSSASDLLPLPSSLRWIASKRTAVLGEFPRSLLVYGATITQLNLSFCNLQSLPHSIGTYMPNLTVSSSRIMYKSCLPPILDSLSHTRP